MALINKTWEPPKKLFSFVMGIIDLPTTKTFNLMASLKINTLYSLDPFDLQFT